MKRRISLKVNGVQRAVEVEPYWTLLEVLRRELALTGAKRGCEAGDCGTCTVLLDGRPVTACLILAVRAQGKEITTIEGIGTEDNLHPLQEAFIEKGAIQCGFCTPGVILSAKALLDVNPSPTEEQVRDAIAGNLCRCTGYVKIVDAILEASRHYRQAAEPVLAKEA